MVDIQSKLRTIGTYLLWVLEHLGFPAFIVLIGILINNYYQAKNQPNLIAFSLPHHSIKILEDNFKISCPFKIQNNGGSPTQNKKLTFLVPVSISINEINIGPEHKSFCDIKEGGPGNSFAVYAINLPNGKEIEGTLVFNSNVEIPEKGMCPLKIIY